MSEPANPIAVIGGGMAGTIAACALRNTGREVILFNAGGGATVHAGGAFDIAGDPEHLPGRPWKANRNLRTNVLRQTMRNALHPYALLGAGQGGGTADERMFRHLDEALDFARAQLSFAGYNLEGQGMRARGYLTALGTIKDAGWVHAPHAAGTVDQWGNARVLLVGIERAAEFDVHGILQTLRQICGERLPKGALLEAVEVQLPILPDNPNLPNIALAQYLETETGQDLLEVQLRALLEQKPATHVILPPVIGLESAGRLLRRLQEETGVVFAEMLGTQSSIPGLRLAQALHGLLGFHDIPVVRERVEAFDLDRMRIRSLSANGQTQPVEAVVFAAGKLLGGGIVKRGGFAEPLFGIDLYAGAEPIGERNPLDLTADDPFARQHFFQVGLRLNEMFQPLDRIGRPYALNLVAAGSILTGYDPAHDLCGLGVAAVTGHQAAMQLIRRRT